MILQLKFLLMELLGRIFIITAMEKVGKSPNLKVNLLNTLDFSTETVKVINILIKLII